MLARSPQPLLREFIEIPEPSATSDSDFVLKLADGVSDTERTLKDYVIPPGLVDNFDQALGLISTALATGASRAAYLHGSFGSGKSHFMAVLYALLRGERAARERDEFAPLLAKHDTRLAGRRFLLVPYHLIGAKSLEQRVLGGYIEQVRRLHPDATIPAVHRTDALLDQSRHLREQIGDEAFIAGLPQGEDKWGDPEGRSWDPAQLDAAFAAAPDDELRRQLVHDLLSTWQQGFFRNALEDSEGFVSLDRGLTEIARHAKELGYDALVLFLDELILWLANSIGDQRFVSREIQKITNFVEGSDARRPIPVVTFIARQRDLRDLVGQEVTGASELGFQDTLNLASGRFDVITLEDRNLPEITRKRLLRRVGGDDGPADQALAEAFERVTRVRNDVWTTLLGTDTGSGADLESFRKTYPFSPAFLSTLVHVSSALQRSRTGLKLMRQLLVDRRDDLRLGDLIPLGDLFDVLRKGGDQPFTEKLKAEFETAQKLYENKLRPYLLERHQLTDDDLAAVRHQSSPDPQVAPRIRAFTGEDRLIKTLILAALAPSVPALRNLTARKLSALNHGSITSPIQGGEVSLVKRRIEDWAARFGEIKMLDGDGVRLDLIGVDVESVLNNVRHLNTRSTRQRLVKRLLWKEFGIVETNQDCDQATLTWRGSRRSIEVVFGNIRDEKELRDEAFHPFLPTSWRLVVDYPFDESGYHPSDDRNRVQQLRSRFTDQVLCWIPASLTIGRQQDLGRLAVLDALLTGRRFDDAAKHLSEDDRRRAHATLTSQRDALTVAVTAVLKQAYGLATKKPEDVLPTYDEHLITLSGGPTPTLPIGARLADALRDVADQLLRQQYPAHPDFDPDRREEVLKPADIRTVLEYVRRAVEALDGRIEVEKKDRPVLRRIANPLLLGEMHEAAFVLGRHWVEHFQRRAGQEGIEGDLRVPDLLRWLDEPRAQGLDPLVAQLVLACFAEQTDRAWIRHGVVVTPQPELTAITGELSLRTPQRPDPADWTAARERAMHLFGFMPPGPARGRLVAMFVQDLSKRARSHKEAAHRLVEDLERHAAQIGLEPRAQWPRLRTAQAAADLLDELDSPHQEIDVVRQLAHADLGGPAERAGRSIRSAEDVRRALRDAPWDTFGLLADLDGQWSTEAAEILHSVRQALLDDELTTPLAGAFGKARSRATELLRRATKRPPRPVSALLADEPTSTRTALVHDAGPLEQGDTVVATDEDLDAALEGVRAVLRQHPERRVELRWRVLP
ncbi:hypothetical protein [Micromonospora sp. NPDC047134]|uniref:hypothetical protein n=1 Tax=Micromonospora sp. NPDC047134 TaxID=3154340 RepID=UPI0033C9A496